MAIACAALPPLCRAEEWVVKGRAYHHVEVLSVNPNTVSINYTGGTGRLPLADLSPELQARFKDAAAIAAAAATDPIIHLVVSLSGDGLWANGVMARIDLPAEATPEQLVPRALQYEVKKQNYRIIRIVHVEQVRIDPWANSPKYTAVLVHGEPSDKIVLLLYEGPTVGWFNRVFDSGY
jgi:hypothetical protein